MFVQTVGFYLRIKLVKYTLYNLEVETEFSYAAAIYQVLGILISPELLHNRIKNSRFLNKIEFFSHKTEG